MSPRPDAEAVMVAAARRAHPNEACGVLVNGVAHELVNVAKDPRHHWAMNLDELIDLADTHGEPEATWHSHPGGRVTPSDEDLDCNPPGMTMYIVARGHVYAYPA